MSADPAGDSAQRCRSRRPVGADVPNRTVPQRLRFSLNNYTEKLTELQHSGLDQPSVRPKESLPGERVFSPNAVGPSVNRYFH